VEVRNQARVHLWFKQRFGADYTPLGCADEALTRYASVVHALGVRLERDDSLDIVASFGLDDLFNMVIRPNRVLDIGAPRPSLTHAWMLRTRRAHRAPI
jgi:uncharacterized protein